MTKKQFEELISAIRELTQAVNALSWNRITYVPYTPVTAPVPQTVPYPTYPDTGKIWCSNTTIRNSGSLPVPQENG